MMANDKVLESFIEEKHWKKGNTIRVKGKVGQQGERVSVQSF